MKTAQSGATYFSASLKSPSFQAATRNFTAGCFGSCSSCLPCLKCLTARAPSVGMIATSTSAGNRSLASTQLQRAASVMHVRKRSFLSALSMSWLTEFSSLVMTIADAAA